MAKTQLSLREERVNICAVLLADLFPSKKCCECWGLPRT